MVGSVLLQRMEECDDFRSFEPIFYSTSQQGMRAKVKGISEEVELEDARDLDSLSKTQIILTCQGGKFSKDTHHKLRSIGWKGFWIDAASALRMNPESVIVLDPVNRSQIDFALENGIKDFIGGNCTVSLMLLALHGLLREGLIDWVSAMTYQAASGAGAEAMRQLVEQMGLLNSAGESEKSILEMEVKIREVMASKDFPVHATAAPLAGGLIPWIDDDLGDGQSREEWKAAAEANRILNWDANPLKIEGVCVRVGTFRCHGQALTFKLSENVSLEDLERRIQNANEWVKVIPNDKKTSIAELLPSKVSGSLLIPIGRIRKLTLGDNIYSAFTLGDQLLWGAAEPLRRALKIIIEHLGK